MVDVFEYGAVLFESNEDEEGLRIECAVTPEGGLCFLQESSGPLTAWSFEESPHRVEAQVGPHAVKGLLEYFHLDEAVQLPAVLRLKYVGYDCFQRIRALMRHLGLAYVVREAPVVR